MKPTELARAVWANRFGWISSAGTYDAAKHSSNDSTGKDIENRVPTKHR